MGAAKYIALKHPVSNKLILIVIQETVLHIEFRISAVYQIMFDILVHKVISYVFKINHYVIVYKQ